LPEDLETTKQLIRDDPLGQKWFTLLKDHAEKLMEEGPLQEPRSGMLKISRQALVRITALAGMYRLTGEERYGKRAIRELVTVSRFESWEPSDFLATAEMSAAVGFGYDWTYSLMSPSERTLVRGAIVEKSLRPGMEEYEGRGSWRAARHNWNPVCNGGLIVAALAVLDEEPRLATQVLERARESIRYGMEGFAPDGGWEEGPTYWNYATRYLGYSLSSLQTALGTDWGLTRAPGFANTGMFRIQISGPTNKPFNFADSEAVIGNCAQMHWFASAFDRPVYAAFEQQVSAGDPGMFDLLWYRPADPHLIDELPRAERFRGPEVACMRSAWNDPLATYVAAKGGSNDAHHGHLDLGHFVLDALGERWVVSLGRDNYDLPGYFSNTTRWTYYRCSTQGQNTLILNNENQEPSARANIIAFDDSEDRSRVVYDLSEAYREAARRAWRGIAMVEHTRVLVQDEIDLFGSTDVRWNMHTTAEVEREGPALRLRQGGKEMMMQIISPSRARLEVYPVSLPPPEEPAPPVLKRISVHLPDARGNVRIAVLFTPTDQRVERAEVTPPPTIVPLREWRSPPP
jgi:hypothetical protein